MMRSRWSLLTRDCEHRVKAADRLIKRLKDLGVEVEIKQAA
jgi:hypothetical protein